MSANSASIRVLVADDHALFREGVMAMLEGAANTVPVGGAGTGKEAVEQARLLRPDVVLMDIMMPDMNGIEATHVILAELPDTKIVILTMLEDDDFLLAAMRGGARGYILKGADREEMLRTVDAIARGDVLFGSQIAGTVLQLLQGPFGRQLTSETPFPELTDREQEILGMIASGSSNTDIARELVISAKTVSNHITSIFEKLQVTDRAQAIVKARRAGIGE